jgi:hypothetical protein
MEVNRKLSIVAISLDDTEQDIKAFELKKKELRAGNISTHRKVSVAKWPAIMLFCQLLQCFYWIQKQKKIIAVPNTLNDLMKTVK